MGGGLVQHVGMNSPVSSCPDWCAERANSNHADFDSVGPAGPSRTHSGPIGAATLAGGRRVLAELGQQDTLTPDGVRVGRPYVWLGNVDDLDQLSANDLAQLTELLQLAGQRLTEAAAL